MTSNNQQMTGFVAECRLHEWVVFSTAVEQGWLMLQCLGCGLHGTVEDPYEDEWSEAFYAPSRPYRWNEEARVVVQGHRTGSELYIMRAAQGQKCECYTRRNVVEPGEYERVPVEVTRRAIRLTEEDRQELRVLAAFVSGSDLCSLLFPVFLKGYEQDSGHRHSEAVQQIAQRIEAIDRKGLHCSPSVVAALLRMVASQQQVPTSNDQ